MLDDLEQRSKEASISVQECGGPYKTVNEVRAERGLAPVEGGDRLPSSAPLEPDGQDSSEDEGEEEQEGDDEIERGASDGEGRWVTIKGHKIFIQDSQMSWEAVPSTSGDVLPGIHAASYAKRMAYTQQVVDVLMDSGSSVFEATLGMPTEMEIGPGLWEGKSNPAVQMRFASGDQESLTALAAGIGAALKQDFVGTHVYGTATSAERANVLVVGFERVLRPIDLVRLGEALNRDDVYLLSENNKIRFLIDNDGDMDSEHGQILSAVHAAGMRATEIEFLVAEIGGVGSDGYKETIQAFDGRRDDGNEKTGGTRFSTFEESVRDLHSDVREVNREFADQEGWGDPEAEGRRKLFE